MILKANHEDWSVLKENFEISSVLVYKEVLKRIKSDLDFCDAVKLSLNEKVGVIEEETPLIYEVIKQLTLLFLLFILL